MPSMLALIQLQPIRDAVAAADASAFRLVNHGMGCAWLDPIMIAITYLGVGWVQAAVGLGVLSVGFVKHRVDLRAMAYAALIAYAGSGILAQIAKHIWNRPRPFLLIFDVRLVDRPLFANSFPSGHTATAFAAAFAWGAFLPRARYVLIALAALVALSRVYLGVHFPLDVVGGALAGSLIGTASAAIFRRHAPEEAK